MSADMSIVSNRIHLEHSEQVYSRTAKLVGSLFAGIFILLVVGGIFYITHSDTSPIKQVRINGDFTHLSPVDLQLLVTKQVRGGFFNLDVDAVRVALLAEPWVNDVTVKRIWPDSIHVTVAEQLPAARWKEKGLLNTSGQYFEPDGTSIPSNLPLLSGPVGAEHDLLNRFNYMNEQVRDIGFEIKSLSQDERRAWSFILSNDIQIILGRRDFEERFRRFLLFVPAVLSDQVGQIALIDMRYTNGLSIKWKNKIEYSAGK